MGVTVSESHVSSGQVRVATWDADGLRERFDGWDDHSPAEKYERLQRSEYEPLRVISTPNVTCVGLDEAIVDFLDHSQADGRALVDELAVGNDSSTTPAHSDTQLNNRIGVIDLAATEDQGSTLFTSFYIDTSQLNGYSLEEVGILDDSDRLLNHSLINAVSKTNSKAVTVEVKLSFTNK